MKLMLSSVIFFVAVTPYLVWSGPPAGKDVPDLDFGPNVTRLTDKNFSKAIQDNKFVCVDFYAPWCGPSQYIAPIFAEVATELKAKGVNILMGAVNCDTETETREKYDIEGFPTIELFRHGRPPIQFRGDRSVQGILKWIVKKVNPPVKTLETVKDVEEFLAEPKVAVIGFFSSLDSPGAAEYLDAATNVDDYVFGIVTNKKVAEAHKVEGDSVVIFKKFDEGRSDLVLTTEAITSFVKVHALPHIVDFGPKTAGKLFDPSQSIKVKDFVLIFLSKSAGHYEEYLPRHQELARAYKNNINFVSVDVDVDNGTSITELFGIKKKDAPTVRLVHLDQKGEDLTKYKPDKEALNTSANLKDFIKRVQAKVIKSYYLSEELPEDWDKDTVKVLVTENFAQVARNPEKHVLVKFYASWCNISKELAPIYDQLAEAFKDNENIVFAQMDAFANELEDLPIDGYPTIKLFKKDTNEVVEYPGSKSLDELKEFIKKETGEVSTQAEEEVSKQEGDKEKSEPDSQKKEVDDSASSKDEL